MVLSNLTSGSQRETERERERESERQRERERERERERAMLLLMLFFKVPYRSQTKRMMTAEEVSAWLSIRQKIENDGEGWLPLEVGSTAPPVLLPVSTAPPILPPATVGHPILSPGVGPSNANLASVGSSTSLPSSCQHQALPSIGNIFQYTSTCVPTTVLMTNSGQGGIASSSLPGADVGRRQTTTTTPIYSVRK